MPASPPHLPQLAFQRIRDLQSAVEDSRLALAAREERIAALEKQAGEAGVSCCCCFTCSACAQSARCLPA